MRTALIGYTGFVGSNLFTQFKFDDLFNSENIEQLSKNEYDLVICAGNRAEKWKINNNPELDNIEITRLKNELSRTRIKKIILISTIDVYKNPNLVDENTVIDTNQLHPYGLNRFYLENYCLNNFDTLIIRLPGLFGRGIKKNIIFDLLNNHNLDNISTNSTYQFYDLNNLWKDIQIALDNDIRIINFATEPIKTKEIIEKCFKIKDFKYKKNEDTSYDVHTIYSYLYNSNSNYIYSKEQIIDDMNNFIKEYKQL